MTVFYEGTMTKAHDGDAGYDLFSTEDAVIAPGKVVVIPSSVKVALPYGVVGLVCSRSGLAAKKSVFVLNSPGVIDAGFRDWVGVILMNAGGDDFIVNRGDRIAQLLIMDLYGGDVVEVSEGYLPESFDGRGVGGYGSSGV